MQKSVKILRGRKGALAPWFQHCGGERPVAPAIPTPLVAIDFSKGRLDSIPGRPSINSAMGSGHGKIGQLKRQEIWANDQETRHSISLISYADCLGLYPVHFSENSRFVPARPGLFGYIQCRLTTWYMLTISRQIIVFIVAKTCVCQCRCNAPWLLRRNLPEKPRPRSTCLSWL